MVPRVTWPPTSLVKAVALSQGAFSDKGTEQVLLVTAIGWGWQGIYPFQEEVRKRLGKLAVLVGAVNILSRVACPPDNLHRALARTVIELGAPYSNHGLCLMHMFLMRRLSLRPQPVRLTRGVKVGRARSNSRLQAGCGV